MDKLPNLVPNSNTPNTEDEQIPLRMTGTDGVKFVPPAVPDLVQNRRIRLHEDAPMYTSATEERELEEVQQSIENVGVCTDLPQNASAFTSSPGWIRTNDQPINSPVTDGKMPTITGIPAVPSLGIPQNIPPASHQRSGPTGGILAHASCSHPARHHGVGRNLTPFTAFTPRTGRRCRLAPMGEEARISPPWLGRTDDI